MTVEIDTHEITQLGQELARLPLRKTVEVAAVVKKGATNIKQAITDDLQTSSNKAFRRVRIHYDMHQDGFTTEADIGPEKGGASDLANIAFFGTSKGGGQHEFYGHGVDELDNTARHIGEVAGKL
ncbi:hypothetical protein [Bifidobacterium sp. ESL0745]|uniref:hypothetical protein n=1 Tax=Bifidobacterium sp. ESL0745 TaxID=2983226 RepID=UPI0023F84B1D|nr:hypothetical protein [Bifidobacterium sp. ESL0745]MDF7665730.1 hypothetical protein [Bifidobacterium sp. ESL0745]